ncbi:MAG TPA: pilus assembly protein PilP [Steroidobacteraceae bacterium]
MKPTLHLSRGRREDGCERSATAYSASTGVAARMAPPWARFVQFTALSCSLLVGLAACSSADDELTRFIDDTKKQPGGRVESLPEIKPYEQFTYSAEQMRSPFSPSAPGGVGANVRPDSKRNREYLEQYPLDTLKMVGTLKMAGHMYGLVQDKDGLVHRVSAGNYLGQQEGKISDISAAKITLTEIVPDGLGGYMERPGQIGLSQ